MYDSDENIYSYEEEFEDNEHEKSLEEKVYQERRREGEDEHMNEELYASKQKIGKNVSHEKIEDEHHNLNRNSHHSKGTKPKKKKNIESLPY